MTNSTGHITEAQPVSAQLFFRYFDVDLFVDNAAQLRQLTPVNVGNVITNPVADASQRACVHIAVDGQANIVVALFPTCHLRLERRLRHIVDLIDANFHVIQKLVHVDIVAPLDVDDTEAFIRDRGDPVEAVNVRDSLFNTCNDLVFDILWRSAIPGNRYRGTRDVHHGEHFLFHLGVAENSAREGDDHQKVCGDGVTGEPGDNPPHWAAPSPVVDAIAAGSPELEDSSVRSGS